MTFTSDRNLLRILRLLTALTRLSLADEVDKDDMSVCWKYPRTRCTKPSRKDHSVSYFINDSNYARTNKSFFIHSVLNTSDKIFALMRKLVGAIKTVKISDVMKRCTTKGYKLTSRIRVRLHRGVRAGRTTRRG